MMMQEHTQGFTQDFTHESLTRVKTQTDDSFLYHQSSVETATDAYGELLSSQSQLPRLPLFHAFNPNVPLTSKVALQETGAAMLYVSTDAGIEKYELVTAYVTQKKSEMLAGTVDSSGFANFSFKPHYYLFPEAQENGRFQVGFRDPRGTQRLKTIAVEIQHKHGGYPIAGPNVEDSDMRAFVDSRKSETIHSCIIDRINKRITVTVHHFMTNEDHNLLCNQLAALQSLEGQSSLPHGMQSGGVNIFNLGFTNLAASVQQYLAFIQLPTKIFENFSEMFGETTHILPSNRKAYDEQKRNRKQAAHAMTNGARTHEDDDQEGAPEQKQGRHPEEASSTAEQNRSKLSQDTHFMSDMVKLSTFIDGQLPIDEEETNLPLHMQYFQQLCNTLNQLITIIGDHNNGNYDDRLHEIRELVNFTDFVVRNVPARNPAVVTTETESDDGISFPTTAESWGALTFDGDTFSKLKAEIPTPATDRQQAYQDYTDLSHYESLRLQNSAMAALGVNRFINNIDADRQQLIAYLDDELTQHQRDLSDLQKAHFQEVKSRLQCDETLSLAEIIQHINFISFVARSKTKVIGVDSWDRFGAHRVDDNHTLRGLVITNFNNALTNVIGNKASKFNGYTSLKEYDADNHPTGHANAEMMSIAAPTSSAAPANTSESASLLLKSQAAAVTGFATSSEPGGERKAECEVLASGAPIDNQPEALDPAELGAINRDLTALRDWINDNVDELGSENTNEEQSNKNDVAKVTLSDIATACHELIQQPEGKAEAGQETPAHEPSRENLRDLVIATSLQLRKIKIKNDDHPKGIICPNSWSNTLFVTETAQSAVTPSGEVLSFERTGKPTHPATCGSLFCDAYKISKYINKISSHLTKGTDTRTALKEIFDDVIKLQVMNQDIEQTKLALINILDRLHSFVTDIANHQGDIERKSSPANFINEWHKLGGMLHSKVLVDRYLELTHHQAPIHDGSEQAGTRQTAMNPFAYLLHGNNAQSAAAPAPALVQEPKAEPSDEEKIQLDFTALEEYLDAQIDVLNNLKNKDEAVELKLWLFRYALDQLPRNEEDKTEDALKDHIKLIAIGAYAPGNTTLLFNPAVRAWKELNFKSFKGQNERAYTLDKPQKATFTNGPTITVADNRLYKYNDQEFDENQLAELKAAIEGPQQAMTATTTAPGDNSGAGSDGTTTSAGATAAAAATAVSDSSSTAAQPTVSNNAATLHGQQPGTGQPTATDNPSNISAEADRESDASSVDSQTVAASADTKW